MIDFGDFVRAQTLTHIQRVRHGQGAFGIQFAELGDEIDDPRQLVHLVCDFIIADFQTRQVCDVLNITFLKGHERNIQPGKIKEG